MSAGIEAHMRNALGHGATREQLMAVLEILSLMGARTVTVGAGILIEEAERAGLDLPAADTSTAATERVREQFRSKLGRWDAEWEALLGLDPGFVERYVGLAADGDLAGELDPGVVELIHIAAHAAVSTMDRDAVRVHMRRALELGVPAGEVLEVLELASVLGIHTLNLGVPALERASA